MIAIFVKFVFLVRGGLRDYSHRELKFAPTCTVFLEGDSGTFMNFKRNPLNSILRYMFLFTDISESTWKKEGMIEIKNERKHPKFCNVKLHFAGVPLMFCDSLRNSSTPDPKTC
jgi:hypothetical protein